MILDDLERAVGLPLGDEPGARAALPAPAHPTARAALEAELRGALQRPPCVVSFSGGRDSSLILAIATAVARRDGLPEPIPATQRFPGVAAAEESDWQRLVVDHLGLTERITMTCGPEHEALGPVAVELMDRHGLLWPPSAHLHAPVVGHAAGGTVVTGIDGDGLMAWWADRRLQELLHGRVRPEPRDVLRAGRALAPRRVRRAVLRRRARRENERLFPWLRPRALDLLEARSAARPAPPRRWDGWVAAYAASRRLHVAARSFAVLGVEHDADVRHPFLAPAFLSALARDGAAAGLGDRTAILRRLGAGLLPDEVLARTSKARFEPALWGASGRAFVERWDGSGVDPDLVDGDVLRAAWARDAPPLAALTIAQLVSLVERSERRACR